MKEGVTVSYRNYASTVQRHLDHVFKTPTDTNPQEPSTNSEPVETVEITNPVEMPRYTNVRKSA